jgi:glutathione-regulated potassium-efflux system ancillary protein KefC
MQIEPYVIDAIWLCIAFLAGLAAKRVGLPALIGYLFTGLFLNMTGIVEGRLSEFIGVFSELGIILLLFTVGLKIKISTLYKKEVLLPAGSHMLLMIITGVFFIVLYQLLSLPLFLSLNKSAILLISFALAFSSTVFAAKILEQRREVGSQHGEISIGILIIQDLFAVLFLAYSSENNFTIWTLAIPPYLFVIRRVLSRLLNASGHSELLSLFGFFAALVAGAFVFKVGGIKPDLGALIIGMMLASHPKSDELYKRMIEYKDFFLISFFVSIGFAGIPDAKVWIAVTLLLPLILIKGFLFLRLLGYSGITMRSSFLSTLALTNFSEFGLIVMMVGVEQQLISSDWVVVLALLLSFSFLLASPLNTSAHILFDKYRRLMIRNRLYIGKIDKETVSFGDAQYLVIGMGSIGKPAYTHFNQLYPGQVVGIDYNQETVIQLIDEGLKVEQGDASSGLFWTYKRLAGIKLVMLAMSDFTSNKQALQEILKMKKRKFKISVIAHYPDEINFFREKGADVVYDYKSQIGTDFAEQTILNTTTN